jgi:hypothetical protein
VSRAQALLGWLEDRSDSLSPLVVKEVRQLVRAREFAMSFGVCLLAGVTIAFFGAADALTGQGTTGGWTFGALTACLALLGLAVVPLGAFTALRHERAEQTLDLITLTALSPRRVVIGKLLAQSVKLATLFALMAPFVAMSFLLGGIDLVTILVSLVLLFMWSVWVCAACVFLSTLFKSRAMSGVIFGVVGLALFLVLVIGRAFVMALSAGAVPLPMFSIGGAEMWWTLAILVTFWLTSLVNFILLAENRLTLPTEDRVTKLRVGFFVQFALIAVWALAYVDGSSRARSSAFETMATTGGLQLALVALFTVTEDLAISRRVRLRMTSSPWRGLLELFGPGGGRGAAYVAVQMALLIVAAGFFQPTPADFRWLVAICAYILFFTGVPAFSLRVLAPARLTAFKLRVAILVFVALLVLLPDLVHYVLVRPDVLDLTFSSRHLVNPFRTLDNWRAVEGQQWLTGPFTMGMIGALAYLWLMVLGRKRATDD